MRLSSLLLASLVSLPVVAQGTKPPPNIFGLYSERVAVCFVVPGTDKTKCEGDTANWILIAPLSNSHAHVQVNLTFFNGHSCEFQGFGKWDKGHISANPADPDVECRLKVRFKGNKAILSDDGQCKAHSCGLRGGFDGIELPKRGSM